MVKAKVQGYYKGKIVPDKYMTKRLLFKPSTGLRKHGTIGKFWLKSPKALWQEVRDKERQIADGLAGVDALERHLPPAQPVDGTVDHAHAALTELFLQRIDAADKVDFSCGAHVPPAAQGACLLFR